MVYLGKFFDMPRPIGQITIIAIGKLKTKHWKLAQDEYLGRLGYYTRLELVELKDMVGSLPDNVAVLKEGELLLHAAAAIPYRIALTPTGQPLTSPRLSSFSKNKSSGITIWPSSSVAPFGFSPETLATCPQQISLSALTYTHEMARIILLEQLYRSFTILNGEKYHK